MLLLYVKYSFLLWVMIGSASKDPLLMSQLSEDETLLKVAACSQNCLLSKPDKVKYRYRLYTYVYDIYMYIYLYMYSPLTLGIRRLL